MKKKIPWFILTIIAWGVCLIGWAIYEYSQNIIWGIIKDSAMACTDLLIHCQIISAIKKVESKSTCICVIIGMIFFCLTWIGFLLARITNSEKLLLFVTISAVLSYLIPGIKLAWEYRD